MKKKNIGDVGAGGKSGIARWINLRMKESPHFNSGKIGIKTTLTARFKFTQVELEQRSKSRLSPAGCSDPALKLTF